MGALFWRRFFAYDWIGKGSNVHEFLGWTEKGGQETERGVDRVGKHVHLLRWISQRRLEPNALVPSPASPVPSSGPGSQLHATLTPVLDLVRWIPDPITEGWYLSTPAASYLGFVYSIRHSANWELDEMRLTSVASHWWVRNWSRSKTGRYFRQGPVGNPSSSYGRFRFVYSESVWSPLLKASQ